MDKRSITLGGLCSGLLMIAALFSGTARAEIGSLGEAIDIAGSQRMLTQRIIRAYGQIGLDVQPEEAYEMRQRSVDRFQRQLDELIDYAPNATVRDALIKVRVQWGSFRALAMGPVDINSARRLLEDGDELLRAAHRVVLRLEDHAGTSYARLVNISGRQRMLSQRLTQLYMLWAWGIESAELRSEMDRAKNEFVGAQKELAAAKENNPRIAALLAEVERQWIVFDKSYRLNNGEYIPLLVSLSSEKILKAMHEATGLYAGLSVR